MTPIEPARPIDTRGNGGVGTATGGGPLNAGEPRKWSVALGQTAFLHFTVIPLNGETGYLSAAPSNQLDSYGTSIVNWSNGTTETDGAPMITPNGQIWVRASQPCHVIVDVFAVGQ